MKEFEKIYDPNKVHIASIGFLDQVTLCGQTDWIGMEPGVKTDKPIDCAHCLEIVNIVRSHRDPRKRIKPKKSGMKSAWHAENLTSPAPLVLTAGIFKEETMSLHDLAAEGNFIQKKEEHCCPRTPCPACGKPFERDTINQPINGDGYVCPHCGHYC